MIEGPKNTKNKKNTQERKKVAMDTMIADDVELNLKTVLQ